MAARNYRLEVSLLTKGTYTAWILQKTPKCTSICSVYWSWNSTDKILVNIVIDGNLLLEEFLQVLIWVLLGSFLFLLTSLPNVFYI